MEFDRVCFSGVTVVNDLLFISTLGGMIHALNRQGGSTLWQFQAPGGINAWPAVAGDTIVWPVGIGGGPIVLALRLNAGAATPTPETKRTPALSPRRGFSAARPQREREPIRRGMTEQCVAIK